MTAVMATDETAAGAEGAREWNLDDPDQLAEWQGSTEQWDMQRIMVEAGVEYATVLMWRRRSREQGGEGPVAMPEPDGVIGASPWWYAGGVRRWLRRTGRVHQTTGKPQRVKVPGKSTTTTPVQREG